VRSGLVGSGKDAKRVIAGGGAKLNDETVSNAGLLLTADDIATTPKISSSKKKHALIKLA
jgi:tyrosyl-tRNA synthetase